jgi:protein-tyrosine phosphatase
VPDLITGRIDVHSHLLPGLDDGCASLDESLACARRLAAEGYTHSFCTPHIWPNLPAAGAGPFKPEFITRQTARLQAALDEAGIPLKLMPGGEINLRPDTIDTPPAELVTFGLANRFALIDLWADELPAFFKPGVRWLQSQGLTVILAHPERMRAVQLKPELADTVAELGVRLQGNLQCFSDPPTAPTRRLAEQFLTEGRYFLLGSDLHNLKTLDLRMDGLKRAIELVGQAEVDRLTRENPAQLLPSAGK